MSARDERPVPEPDEEAEDQSSNEIGFRDVDEEQDYDESGGPQGSDQEPRE